MTCTGYRKYMLLSDVNIEENELVTQPFPTISQLICFNVQ